MTEVRTTFTDEGRVYTSAEPCHYGMICIEEDLQLAGVVRRVKGRAVAYENLRLFEPLPIRRVEVLA